jgi:hypothetical protein
MVIVAPSGQFQADAVHDGDISRDDIGFYFLQDVRDLIRRVSQIYPVLPEKAEALY